MRSLGQSSLWRYQEYCPSLCPDRNGLGTNCGAGRACASAEESTTSSCNGRVCPAQFYSDLVRQCPNLIALTVSEAVAGCGCWLNAVAAFCPRLQELRCGLIAICPHPSETAAAPPALALVLALTRVLQQCGELHTVSVATSLLGRTSGPIVSDAVARHCRQLRSFSVRGGTGGDSLCLLSLLTPRMHQLEHLVLDSLEFSNEGAELLALAQGGGQLKSLSLRNSFGASEAAMTALFLALASVEELDLSNVKNLRDGALRVVGGQCKRLRFINLDEAWPDGFTTRGVCAVLAGCPVLARMNLDCACCDIVPRLRAMRPDVRFTVAYLRA